MDASMISYLQMLQGVISRLAQNSFALKGWGTTLAAAVFAVTATKDIPPVTLVVALVPTAVFWGLDGYYLRRERMFRELYQVAVAQGLAGKAPTFSMNVVDVEANVPNWFRTCWSKTVGWFYGSLAVITLAAIVALEYFPKIAPTP